jgi:hypothetical protein
VSNTELTNEFAKGIKYMKLSDGICRQAKCPLAAVNTIPSLDNRERDESHAAGSHLWECLAGIREVRSVKVEDEYSTVTIKPREDIEPPSIETGEIFQ